MQVAGLRYYNPGLGRWTSRDPIEEDGGVGLYAFLGNEAIGEVDPVGLVWEKLKLCEECPDGYWNSGGFPRDSYKEARDALGSYDWGKVITEPDPADACGKGGGDHYNHYWKKRKSSNYIGSVLCCHTCDNVTGGALYQYVCKERRKGGK